jgi:exopolysaccharide biosynthesis polyprenyl glycosylphosphotransferase
MHRLLVGADVAGLAVAFVFALAAATPANADARIGFAWELAVFVLTLPLWVVLARLHGLYDSDEERSDHSSVDDIVKVFQVVTIGAWSFLAFAYVTGLPYPTLPSLIAFWSAGIVLIPSFRAGARVIGRRRAEYIQKVVIVGSGQVARLLATKVQNHPEYGLSILGFVDRDGGASWDGSGAEGLDLIGTVDDLPDLVRTHSVDRVVIAFTADSHEESLDVIRALQGSDVRVDIVPRLFEVLGASAQLHTIEGLPLIGLPTTRLSPSAQFLKRALDIVGAALGLVVFMPLLALTALCIKLDSRGPVLFRQVRMGAGERSFRVFKFRTMVADADAMKDKVAHLNMHLDDDPRMFKVPNDPRVTRVGAYLRRFRIDELPQFLNVIRGEMSLVGPRPLILDEDQYVERWARRRLQLKPGVTGLWQVLGASDIPFDEMTKLDYLYVTNWSLREDLRLILLTVPALLRKRLAY